ncbi:MAG TPA: discoidin domain-containing protein [Steroidobacteraceae bacterium]|jgi:hypothetical protein|nr:discoidin domain-containing protein [Steroidobacteraceae bacterium]
MQEQNKNSSSTTEWQPVTSGQAQLTLRTGSARQPHALCMDYDFKGGGGFVVARRASGRDMPEDYVVTFRLRGSGPRNNLELKLVDGAGQNVWRHVYKDLDPPRHWKRFRLRARDIEFAWGPASGARLTRLGSIELAVVAGQGGKGTLWLADLDIEDATPKETPRLSASSELPGFEASHAIAGPGWRPRTDDAKPWIEVDWTAPRTLGGIVIDWLEHAPARGFRLRASSSGSRWKTVYAAPRGGGHRSYLYLPDLTARYLRLEIPEANAGAALQPQSFQFARSLNVFWQSVAAREDRGWHPRWLHNEQTVWTPVGTARGTPSALMNEDGMVEPSPGSWCIEPMLFVHGRLYTWNDVTLHQELQQGWMPVPASVWEGRDWRLKTEAFATTRGTIRVSYRLENLSAGRMAARLFLVIRPFQVTPPWQSFREFGGISTIRHLAWHDGAVRVDDDHAILPAEPPAAFGAMRFDEGLIASHLAAGRLPASRAVHDPRGFASGALSYEITLDAGQSVEHRLTTVSETESSAPGGDAFDWSAARGPDPWLGHGWMQDAIESVRTATAHVLLTRAGPALQPGPRRYTRSWIRDGAMMGAALLRMGHTAEVREFIRWYAPHQRADGFVPCCVDRDGPDWLVEHDSHGQLIALIGDYRRFAGDDALVRECWDHIERAARFIEGALEPDGLLPVSVSHEGYLAQPVHAFWDDFWAVKGLEEAAYLADLLGRSSDARHWQELSARVARGLFAAIETTRAQRGLEFIPGSIEWADFDPTATANAIYLLDVPEGLDRAAVERTFDRYLADWRSKRAGAGSWTNYTPYEIRIIGALVRLGRRDAALELLRFFLSDRRPVRWNQWPEIAWRDHRTPGHVGDLPHTWIAAEYVLAVRSLFAYERPGPSAAGSPAQRAPSAHGSPRQGATSRPASSLVVAAGVATEWLEGPGVRVAGLPTLHGALDLTLRRTDADTIACHIGAGLSGPIELRAPFERPLAAVRVNGQPYKEFDAQSVNLLQTPAEITCTMAP